MTDGPSEASPAGAAEPSLGAALRAAREAAGLTVEQVSASTRIRATLVRDLEADRFGSSGAAVYARGHLRAIAAAVGADQAALLARFDAEQGRPVPVLDVPAQEQPPSGFGGTSFLPPVASAPERRGPRWGAAVVGAAAVLVAVLAVGVWQQNSSRTPAGRTALQAGPTATKVAAPPPVVVHTPAPGSLASKPPVTNAQLRVRLVGGTSWVSVRNGTTTLFEGVLRPGQFKDFTDATRLRVTVGNASAVDLDCGGHDSGPAGGAGMVLRFSCTKDGLTPA